MSHLGILGFVSSMPTTVFWSSPCPRTKLKLMSPRPVGVFSLWSLDLGAWGLVARCWGPHFRMRVMLRCSDADKAA